MSLATSPADYAYCLIEHRGFCATATQCFCTCHTMTLEEWQKMQDKIKEENK